MNPFSFDDSVPSKGLDIRATDDGHIDLPHLERTATLQRMKDWIRSRLNGQDPHWPIHLRDLEPPHDLFVTLAKRSGPGGQTRVLIEESLCELLPEARRTNPPWRAELLKLVRILRPARCGPILESVLLKRHDFTEKQIAQGVDMDWLLTAAAYQSTSLHREWLEILEKPDPRHSTVAYRALAQDGSLALLYLPAFARALRVEDREPLIRSAVRLAFERCRSPSIFLEYVRRNWAQYREVSGLEDLVAGAIESLKLPLPCVDSPGAPRPVPPTPKRPVSYERSAAVQQAAAR